MIIVSEKFANTTINISNNLVHFVNHEAEVSDEIGATLKELGAEYYEKGKKPVKRTEKKTENQSPDRQVAEMESKLLIASQKVEELKAKLDTSITEAENWKAEYNKVSGNAPIGSKISAKDVNVILDLAPKTKTDLQDFCKQLELSQKEWQSLGKNELIYYIVSKTL